MEILYLLVPLAVILAGLIVWAFLWAICSGQFDDLEGPAHRIIMEQDEPAPAPASETEERKKMPAGRGKRKPLRPRNR